MIYLACPYSHPDASVRRARFRAANRAAARLMAEGLLVFSPISHSHPIAECGELPGNWAYWEAFDRAVLGACSELRVLKVDGYQTSEGIAAEILIARELGMPVTFADPASPHCGVIG